jgi:hypothetical protein
MAIFKDGVRHRIVGIGELGAGRTVDSVDISGIRLNSMPTAADGAISCNDQNLTNVGDVALDSISSDAGTSIAITLGTDAGDDLIVATDALVVEGDNKNVGIGTAAPTGKLEVVSGNDGDGTITVRSGNATQYSKISMGTNANKATIGCPGAADTFFTGAAQGDLVIRADDNNNKVHIGAGTSGPAGMVVTEVSDVGRVGVGTSSPTVPLEVQDATASSATQGGNLRLSADDGARMGSGHRLGTLEFAGAEDASNNITVGARIEALTDASWSATENGADMLFYTTDGNASQSEQMRILADGKVGIGVVDPDAALEVLQGSGNQLKLSFDGTDNATFSVDTAGDLTIVPSGGDVAITGTVEATSYKGTVLKALTAYATAVGASSTAENATNKTLVIPANTLVAGDRIQMRYMGSFTAASTPAMDIKVKVTDDDSHSYTVFTNSNGSTGGSGVHFGIINLSFLAVGSTGRMDYFANGFGGAAATADGGVYKELDTTTAITVSVTCQFDASNASNTFTLRELSAVRDSIN